jgi:fucose 4-O-acetylase-like acetyltransferase
MSDKKERLLYIDNIRLLMIIFVIIMHLAVTYSGLGSWYFNEGRPVDTISIIIMGFYQSFTQAYFMGVLFLLASYFVPKSYDKKGLGLFIKDRLIRLGIPTLIYMLIISPFIEYVEINLNGYSPKPDFLTYFIHYIYTFDFIGSTGPLWFAFALLIFSIIYGLVRYFADKVQRTHKALIKPNLKNEVLLVLIIALFAFSIRLVLPVGTSIINMQLCYFAQYIILFAVGAFARRNNLFSSIEYKQGKRWLLCALIPATFAWILIIVLGGVLDGNQNYNGGLSWQAAAYALWESFVAVGMSIGLIAIFRERHNHQSKLIKVMSDNSFAVYVFHAPIIIAAAILIHPLNLPPIVKFVILCVVCIPLVFVFTHFVIRRIPLLKRVM